MNEESILRNISKYNRTDFLIARFGNSNNKENLLIKPMNFDYNMWEKSFILSKIWNEVRQTLIPGEITNNLHMKYIQNQIVHISVNKFQLKHYENCGIY